MLVNCQRGTPRKIWQGCAARFPKPSPYLTKICDFPYHIYDLTKNLMLYL